MIDNALTQICMFYFSKTYNFDSQIIAPITLIISTIISFLLNLSIYSIYDQIKQLAELKMYILFTFVVVYLYTNIFKFTYHKKILTKIYTNTSITIHDKIIINNIANYLITNNYIANEYLECNCRYFNIYKNNIFMSPKFESNIPFIDHRNNIYGTINFILVENRKYKDEISHNISVTLTVNNNCKLNNIDYINLINSSENKKENGFLSISYIYNCYGDEYNSKIPSHAILFGKQRKFAEKICKIQASNKKNYFNKTHMYIPNNYILEGGPGTGKSTFISGLASMIGADIAVIDNNIFKHDIGQINELIQTKMNSTKNYVLFVFEEIDYLISYLLNNDNYDDNDDDNDDDFDDKKSQLNKNNIRKLLIVIQSAFTHPLSQFIATTNKIDFIKEKIPELIRIGRLTPINFDNYTNQDVSDFIKHYYHIDYNFDANIKLNFMPTNVHMLYSSICIKYIDYSLVEQAEIFIKIIQESNGNNLNYNI